MSRASFTVVGGGPVGTLLAISLARHGYTVGLYEGRPDSRRTSIYQGKSINIALSDRGWTSLEKIGISADVKEPVDSDVSPGRTRRRRRAELAAIRSAKAMRSGQFRAAELTSNCWTLPTAKRISRRILSTGWSSWISSQRRRLSNAGCDLTWSSRPTSCSVQTAQTRKSDVWRITLPRFSYSQNYMPQCYIELNIPANADGTHRLEKNALHIWPRKDFMLIALPNPDGTFTCTLFMNFAGEPSFESLQEHSAVKAFFEANFADAMPYLENPVDTFLEKAAAPLFLVQVFPWSFNQKIGLIGDAAHAIVPFYGQGMNCGFEDCAELDALIEEHDHNWDKIFPAYENARKPNGDAIAELSKRNFVEMSDLSGDRLFQLQKKIEAKFSQLHPELWTPLYSMVTFSPDVPYAEALRIGDEQKMVMDQIMALPTIESDWDKPAVMDRLLELATESFGDAQ